MADLPSNNPPFHQFPLHCYYYYHHLPSFPYPDATVFIPTPHPQGFILPPTYQYGYCAYASVLPMPMTPPYPYPPTSAAPAPAPAPLFGYPPYDYLPYFPPPPPSKVNIVNAGSSKEREVQRQQNNVKASPNLPALRRGTGVFHSPFINHKNTTRSNSKRGGRKNNKKGVNGEGSKKWGKREEGSRKQEECAEAQVYLPDQDIALPNEWTY